MPIQPRQLFESNPYYYVFGPHLPQVKLDSGATLGIDCVDCDNRLPDGSPLPASRRQGTTGSMLFEGNPVAGPIEVAGAMPGDSIAIRILDLRIPAGIGQTGLAPGHGLLPAHLVEPQGSVPRHLYRWDIDPKSGRASLSNRFGEQPIEVALKPFIGCIGVCPDHGQQVGTLYAGTHGGNMDIPSLGVGATVTLPVFAPGALLMLGDLHAAQGHGEAIGGAIETPGQVDIEVRLLKNRPLGSPRLQTPSELGAVASDGDVRAAIQQAYSRLLHWLAAELSMNRFDAFNLLSQTARIEIGNLVVPPFTVAALVSIDALPRHAKSILEERS